MAALDAGGDPASRDPSVDTDVFVSFSNVDDKWVHECLGPSLDEAGISWRTHRKAFPPGTPVLENIDAAIERCRRTILVLSPEYLESKYCMYEARQAQWMDVDARDRRVLPIVRRECTLPRSIDSLGRVDFIGDGPWDEPLRRLVDVIKDRDSGGAREPARPKHDAGVSFFLPQGDLPIFEGRERELAHLEAMMTDADATRRVAVVVGARGVGKSALASAFADRHRAAFPDGVFGVMVDDDKDADAVARQFAALASRDVAPNDTRKPSAIMQAVFGARRALLIVDNADRLDVRALLPSGSRCSVLVTTINRGMAHWLAGPDRCLELRELDDDVSLRLLDRHLQPGRLAVEPEAARRIVKAVAGLPLALRIVGASLRLRDWWPLADYADALDREKLELLQAPDLKDVSVRASFGLTMKLLAREESTFFASLGVCAADGFSVLAAMAATGVDETNAQEHLVQLRRWSLIALTSDTARRFVLHPLLRLFARAVAADWEILQDATQRHATFYVERLRESNRLDRRHDTFFTQELDELLLAAHSLRERRVLDGEFMKRFGPLLERHGRWKEATDLFGRFVEVAVERGDRRQAILLSLQEAKFRMRRNDLDGAARAMREVPRWLADVMPETDRLVLEARWLTSRGTLLRSQRRNREAADLFRRAVDIERQVGKADGLAMALNSLGSALGSMDQEVSAEACFREALDIARREPDLQQRAKTLNSLGSLLRESPHQRFLESVDLLIEGRDVCEQDGDQRMLALILNSLGLALQKLNRFDEAAAAFERAAEAGERVPDWRSVATSLRHLGELRLSQNDSGGAIDAFERSNVIAADLGDPLLLGRGRWLVARAYRAHGRLGDALREFVATFEIYERNASASRLEKVAAELATALNSAGRGPEVATWIERALDVAPSSPRLKALLGRQH